MLNDEPHKDFANRSTSTTDLEPPDSRHKGYPSFQELRDNGEFFDFKVVVGEEEFPVHKLVLIAESDYFRAMLAHDSKESQEGKIIFRDLSPETFRSILDFCYTGHLDLNHENTQPIIVAASMLQMRSIQDVCAGYIEKNLDSTNSLGVFILSERINLKSLADRAWIYCLNNFQSVSEEPEFTDLPVDFVKRLISDDHLNVEDESEVMDAIKRWIESDMPTREQHLFELMELVRFTYIDLLYLTRLSFYEPIRISATCRDYLDIVNHYFILKKHPDELIFENYPEKEATLRKIMIKNPRVCPRKQRLFAVGGLMDKFRMIGSLAEVYNPNSDTWSDIKSMNQKRCGVGLVTHKDSIYAIGGHDGTNYLSSVERYDIYEKEWFHDIAELNYVRTSVGVASLDRYIYAIGGQISSNGATDKVERYEPETNTWQECQPLLKRRLGAGVVTCEGKIYVMGGGDGSKIFNSVEQYDPQTDSWRLVTEMSYPRKHMGCCSYKDCIYVVGGRCHKGELKTGEVYNTRTDTWTAIAKMSVKRWGIGLVEMADLLYAVGGSTPKDVRMDLVECYDPSTDSWSTRASMKVPRLGGGMAVHPVILSSQIRACQ